MTHAYTPSPNALTTVTLPDDLDPRTAASVNVPFEQLADAIDKLQSGLVVVNVGLVALTLQYTTSVVAGISPVKFNPYTLEWLGGGVDIGFGQFVRTNDLRSWPNSTEIGGTIIGSYDGAFAFDNNGTIIMPGNGVTDGSSIQKYTGSWAVSTGVFSTALVAPDIVWDDVNLSWCVAGKNSGAFSTLVYTSTNGSTFTGRVPPTGIVNDGVSGPYCRLGYYNGVIVMQMFKSSHPGAGTSDAVSFSRSTDGGQTWTAADVHAITWSGTGSNSAIPSPVFDGTSWVAVFGNDGDNDTYVYSSSDGATFTQVAHLTSCCIYNICTINAVVVGYCKDHTGNRGRIVASFDHGVTWKYTDEFIQLTSTLDKINSSGNRLVLSDTSGNLIIGSGVGIGMTTAT